MKLVVMPPAPICCRAAPAASLATVTAPSLILAVLTDSTAGVVMPPMGPITAGT